MYLKYARDDQNQTIDFKKFLSHFEISSANSSLLQNICNQIQALKVNIGELTMKQDLNFADFISLLEKAKVKIPEQSGKLLESLFFQLSDDKEEITK